MTSHPATHPMIVQFAQADDEALRARLVLATPFGVLREFRMLYRAALEQKPSPAIAHYLAALDVADAAVRDRFGHLPADVAEQLTAARLMLCVTGGAIRLEPASDPP